MPRAKRLSPLRYACYYYRRKGARERPIIRDRDELQIFLSALVIALRKSGAKLYAFHIDAHELHLVVRAGRAPLIPALGVFLHEVTRRLNRRRGESGPMFVQRARITVLQPELWLLPVARYVHSIRLRGDPLSSWSSDRTYRARQRMSGLTTTAITRLLVSRMHGSSILDCAYPEYFDAPASREEIHLIEHGSSRDSRVLGDEPFVTRVMRAQGETSALSPANQEGSDQAIERAAELVIGRLHALCRQYLNDRDARNWITQTDLQRLRSKSRKPPLPFVRGMVADYALARRIAKRREIERFFGLHSKSLAAGLRQRYRSKMLECICRESGPAHYRVPYIQRGVQRVNAELLVRVIAVVFDS